MTELALDIQDISKAFGNTKALDQVSIQVPQGSIFGLLGPNGAGKTTLFSIIASFLHSDAGKVRVLGTDVSHISELQGRLSILPQDALFQNNVPILEQLMFFRLLDGQDKASAEEEVRETLAKVGLEQYMKRGVQALSHGMLKRMGIAQAFLGNPEVIILDEPTAGLDPQNARQIRDLIQELQLSRSATTVISSHNLQEIQELCDHVAILHEGKLMVTGTVEEVTSSGRLLELELSQPLTESEQEKLGSTEFIQGIQQLGRRKYSLALQDNSKDADIAGILRCLLDMNCVPTLLREGNSLEKVFLQMTGGNSDKKTEAQPLDSAPRIRPRPNNMK